VLAISEKQINDILGSPDDMKFRSSMTLFDIVSKREIFARSNRDVLSGRQGPGHHRYPASRRRWLRAVRDGHYIENTGAGPLRFLEIFRSDRYADLSLNQWLAATPRSLVGAYLRISTEVIAALPATKKPDTAWVAIVMGRQEQSRSLPVAL